MCGIAGKVLFGSGEVSRGELKLMADSLVHRGPDGEGYYISSDKKLGLAHRRLSIIDLSKKGSQPMGYSGGYQIVFNGEVYNFMEERKKLEKKGYKFRSKTDTEVVLALYAEYGVGCLQRMRGMFAFAIYDPEKQKMFLARDRLGKKPLKYFFQKGVFIFASELKAILTQKEVKVSPNWSDIHHYLTFGYVPSPGTGLTEIKKLEPASYMIVDLKSGRINKRKYWEIDYNNKLDLGEDDLKELIVQKLEEATKLRLVSDVALGAFLSGGVDSSSVVATMASLSGEPVKTFTIKFNERKYDESEYATRISKLYKTQHHEFLAKPEAVDEVLPYLVERYEEPYADSSNVATYMVSKLAKKYVTVVLNGDGGDENFTGYMRHSKIKRDVWVSKFGVLTRLGAVLPLGRISKYLKNSSQSFAERYVRYNSFFWEEKKRAIYSNKLLDLVGRESSYKLMEEKFCENGARDARDRGLYTDMSMYLPDDLLVKTDIAGMSVSLECRSPLLDHEFVEMAARIEFDKKVNDRLDTKVIFKKALEGIVPRENLYRQKMGFSIPLDMWFSGGLAGYAKSVLLAKEARTREYLKTNEVKRMLAEHGGGKDFGPRLWALVNLELWMRKYL